MDIGAAAVNPDALRRIGLPVVLREWDLDAGLAKRPLHGDVNLVPDALPLVERIDEARISKSNALSPKRAKNTAQYPGGGGTGM